MHLYPARTVLQSELHPLSWTRLPYQSILEVSHTSSEASSPSPHVDWQFDNPVLSSVHWKAGSLKQLFVHPGPFLLSHYSLAVLIPSPQTVKNKPVGLAIETPVSTTLQVLHPNILPLSQA